MKSVKSSPDEKNFLQIGSEDFEKCKTEIRGRIAYIREETDKWRKSNKLKIVLSNKYR